MKLPAIIVKKKVARLAEPFETLFQKRYPGELSVAALKGKKKKRERERTRRYTYVYVHGSVIGRI